MVGFDAVIVLSVRKNGSRRGLTKRTSCGGFGSRLHNSVLHLAYFRCRIRGLGKEAWWERAKRGMQSWQNKTTTYLQMTTTRALQRAQICQLRALEAYPWVWAMVATWSSFPPWQTAVWDQTTLCKQDSLMIFTSEQPLTIPL